MEASVSRKKWSWDDSKWIISLLLTLILSVFVLIGRTWNTPTAVKELSDKVDEMHRTFVPGSMFFDAVDLLRNENKEYIGMIKKDSAAISQARVKYDELWIRLKKDVMESRGSGDDPFFASK